MADSRDADSDPELVVEQLLNDLAAGVDVREAERRAKDTLKKADPAVARATEKEIRLLLSMRACAMSKR